MSAWLVSREHIDVLVTAGIDAGLITPDEAVETGEFLWRANAANLRFLYGDRADECGPVETEGYGAYQARRIDGPHEYGWLLTQATCYDYQSCDAPTWPTSQAKAYIIELAERLETWAQISVNTALARDYCWGVEINEVTGQLILTSKEFSDYLRVRSVK